MNIAEKMRYTRIADELGAARVTIRHQAEEIERKSAEIKRMRDAIWGIREMCTDGDTAIHTATTHALFDFMATKS